MSDRITVADDALPGPRSTLVLCTTMATWRLSCLAEWPALRYLRESFALDELEMFGIPYDVAEGAALLAPWADRYASPYEILAELSDEMKQHVKKAVVRKLRIDGVPAATIITSADGRILSTRWGPPTPSEPRPLLMSETRTR